MNSVDNLDKKGRIISCDHVQVYVDYLKAHVPTAMIATAPPTYLIEEEGKIKLLCGRCLRKALEMRAESFRNH